MKKKTAGTTISIILCFLFICLIGSTLSDLRISVQKVEVKAISLELGENIKVTNKDGEELKELEIKSNEIGVRPATGEQDSKTNIPSTINDSIGTEGAYACFYLTTLSDYSIRLKSVSVTNGLEDNIDNLFFGIMDGSSEAVSMEKVGCILKEGERTTNEEMIVVAWLDADTTKSIVGADISFVLEIVSK